jgi:hypothetical protein
VKLATGDFVSVVRFGVCRTETGDLAVADSPGTTTLVEMMIRRIKNQQGKILESPCPRRRTLMLAFV